MCGIAASAEARMMDDTLTNLSRVDQGSYREDAGIEAQATDMQPTQYLPDSSHSANKQKMHDLQQTRAVSQTQLTGRTTASRSSATMDTAQPARHQTTADGVYEQWQQQGLSTSAIITLAAEVQILAIQLSEKSEDRLHVLRVARALIDAHDMPFSHVGAGARLSCLPGTHAPSTAIGTQSDDSSSAKHQPRCSRVDPNQMARDAIQRRDISMQMASDIIHRLPIKQRRIGIKYMALGRQQFR
eukprot:3462832-Amphidinium_carterae.1